MNNLNSNHCCRFWQHAMRKLPAYANDSLLFEWSKFSSLCKRFAWTTTSWTEQSSSLTTCSSLGLWELTSFTRTVPTHSKIILRSGWPLNLSTADITFDISIYNVGTYGVLMQSLPLRTPPPPTSNQTSFVCSIWSRSVSPRSSRIVAIHADKGWLPFPLLFIPFAKSYKESAIT